MTTTLLTNQELQNNSIDGTISSNAKSIYKNTEHAASVYAQSGLSVLPVKQDKSPALHSLDSVKKTIASPKDISSWYTTANLGVGILTGAISGNLELLDIDEKYNADSIPLLDQLTPLINQLAPELLNKLVHETSQNGGHHFVYRCRTIEGNKKLARRKPTIQELKKEPKLKSVTLLETRGEGGYFVCYPSSGYALVLGSFTEIPEISEQERKILLDCARSLNQVSAEEKIVTGIPKKRSASIIRPGDDFNIRGNIEPILQETGWQFVYANKDIQYWRRPRKTDGISASFNKHPNMFYVFSSNASPLESETWYTKFALLGLLKYSGNFEFAAKDLADEGYGETTTAKAESYLKDRFEFQYNEVKGRVEFRKTTTDEFKTLEDYELNSINREMLRAHIQMSKDSLGNLLESDYSPRYDPFRNYFETLPAFDNSIDYISQLADTVTLKDQTSKQVFKEYLKKWLVATVGCAINPNIINHTCLTLVGAQGRYKSTWLNRLVPKALSQYIFSGTIDPTNKDSQIHLTECFLINLDELETLSKHELGSLKSLMTYQTSRLRRPYDKYAGQLTRRASFVGSINRSDFLTDETGSRRFLIFEIDTIDGNHSIDMDNVYAQAYHLLKSGFQYWFDRSETDTVNERNKGYAVQTTEDELILKYCKKPEATDLNIQWYTATEVAKRVCVEAQYPFGKSSARDFGFALKKGNYLMKKVHGISWYAAIIETNYSLHPTLGGVLGGERIGVVESISVDFDSF